MYVVSVDDCFSNIKQTTCISKKLQLGSMNHYICEVPLMNYQLSLLLVSHARAHDQKLIISYLIRVEFYLLLLARNN